MSPDPAPVAYSPINRFCPGENTSALEKVTVYVGLVTPEVASTVTVELVAIKFDVEPFYS